VGRIDQVPRSINRFFGDPGRLLHVVGHDDDSEILFKVQHQALDLFRGHGVQGGAGFVHQDNAGLQSHDTGEAEPLLLFEVRLKAD